MVQPFRFREHYLARRVQNLAPYDRRKHLPAKSFSANLVPNDLPQKAEPIAVEGKDQAKLVQRMLQEEEKEHREQVTTRSEISQVNHGCLVRETRVATKETRAG